MIKRRNLMAQVLLFIVTFGIYGIYWFYVTSREMVEYRKLEGSPGLWTILLFIPFGVLYSSWKHAHALEALTDKRYPWLLVWVLWLVFSPAVWIMTQIELNKLASE